MPARSSLGVPSWHVSLPRRGHGGNVRNKGNEGNCKNDTSGSYPRASVVLTRNICNAAAVRHSALACAVRRDTHQQGRCQALQRLQPLDFYKESCSDATVHPAKRSHPDPRHNGAKTRTCGLNHPNVQYARNRTWLLMKVTSSFPEACEPNTNTYNCIFSWPRTNSQCV